MPISAAPITTSIIAIVSTAPIAIRMKPLRRRWPAASRNRLLISGYVRHCFFRSRATASGNSPDFNRFSPALRSSVVSTCRLLSSKAMPESVLTRRPPRAVLENYFLQHALGFGRGWIQRCLSFVSLALFDRLLSRVDYVLPRDRGLLHHLSPGVGFFQSNMDFLDGLVGVHLDLVRDARLVGRYPAVDEFKRRPAG